MTRSLWHHRRSDDFRLRFNPGDEDAARALAFAGGNYPQDEASRLLRLALHEIDVLRADGERIVKERDLVYGELNRAVGEHAPKAWDRIKAALDA